jgi:biopolymer transport protein ExbD
MKEQKIQITNPDTSFYNSFEKTPEDSFPDLIPLVDVVFMLIIFFLLTSSLIGEKNLSINLPTASSGEISQAENIVIEIDKENNIFYQSVKINAEELEIILKDTAIKTQRPLPEVIIRSDEDCSFGTVIQVMDIIQSSGYDTVSFAVMNSN